MWSWDYGEKLAENAEHAAAAAQAAELDALSIGEALTREEARLENGIEHISTGWKRFDAKLDGGLAIPSLTVIGAPPKSSKSTWVQMIATRHVESGGFAYLLDLENGRTRVLRQILCRACKLAPSVVKRALADERAPVFKTSEEAERWREAKAWLRTMLASGLFVEFAPLPEFALEMRLQEIRKRAVDKKLLIAIDSLQKLPGGFEDRRATVDRWVRFFERMRIELNAAFLVVSEIKRGRERYVTGEDVFKESGGIEYAADLALTLSRPRADEKEANGEKKNLLATLRVEIARDSEEDPRGDVASYEPVRPHYGLEEIAPVPRSGRGSTSEKGDLGDKILALIRRAQAGVFVGGVNVLAERLGANKAAVGKALGVLCEVGDVENTGTKQKPRLIVGGSGPGGGSPPKGGGTGTTTPPPGSGNHSEPPEPPGRINPDGI